MKRIATLVLAATTTLAIAPPVLAGGPTVPATEPVIVPEPMPVVAPSADWSGAYGGAQLGYGDVDSNGAGADGYGWLGGVHAGYRWDLGGTVLGVEGDYDAADLELGGGTGSLDSIARLKLSAGADLGSTLVYGTAGGAWADGNLAGVEGSGDGYFYGLGVTRALNDSWSVGAEVLQHTFDDFDGSGTDLDATTLTARASYNF